MSSSGGCLGAQVLAAARTDGHMNGRRYGKRCRNVLACRWGKRGKRGCGSRLRGGHRGMTKPPKRSWDAMGTIFTALAEDSTQGMSSVQKQGARDLPWAVSRCLGFHRARCGGTSLRSLGTQEPLPCGDCAAGGSTERSVGWDTCQWECSAGRKLLRLSLSCLISISRTRLFWKHTVEECP